MAPAAEPSPPTPPPGSRVVQRAAERRARLRRVLSVREWTRLPAPLLITLLLHGAAGWWLWTQVIVLAPAEVALVAKVSDEALVDPLEPEVEQEPIELEEPEVVEFEPVLTESIDNLDSSDDFVDILGLGSSGLGGGSGGNGLRPGSLEAGDVETGLSPFDDYVSDLRGRGVEVCFVVDATGSMQRFIDRARETIDRIVGDLATVVPDARIAVVAYRDLNDNWVTRRTELTSNRYLVHNFLLDLEASGGKRETADFEEAVEVGLAVASRDLDWRAGARRVLILVGDAPYHEEDRGETMSVVREFMRDDHSLVNTVYVGAPGVGLTSMGAKAAIDAFERIAKAGDGHSFHLALTRDDPSSGATALGGYRVKHSGAGGGGAEVPENPELVLLRRQVLDATFGPEWREQIDLLLAAAPRDSRRTMAQRHEERGDGSWFSRQLLLHRLHPAIIDGARRLFDGRIAVSCVLVLENEAAGEPMRAAVLNILKTSVADFSGLPYDVSQPPGDPEQRRLAALMRNRVLKMVGAKKVFAELQPGRSQPPPKKGGAALPPPPPPGGAQG